MSYQQVEILLVEDSKADADMTMRTLKKRGIANNVQWVKNGVEAMEAIPVTQRRLGIRTELTDTEIVAVRIWDSGPGIAPGLYSRVRSSRADGPGH